MVPMVRMSVAVALSARGVETVSSSTQSAWVALLHMGRMAVADAPVAHFGSLKLVQSPYGAPVCNTEVRLVVIREIEVAPPKWSAKFTLRLCAEYAT